MAHLSLNSPLGPLTVFEDGGAIVAVEWGRAPDGRVTPLLADARDQLDAYFDGRRRAFDLPLRPAGSPFQRAVWDAIAAVPYGDTASYGDLARRLGSSPRAVGGACGRNPIAVVIPCHRIVGSGGRLTGYSGGDGLTTKDALLRLEGHGPALPLAEIAS